MTELGLVILIVGVLLLLDRERVAWVADKVRDLIEWLSS